MAQNIVIAGATFNAVPSIVVPTSNNGTAVFVDPSPTTATDSDVASGKIYFKADGTQSTGTASGGGGGASNVVFGTFKGTEGGAIDITLPYAGNGFPMAVFICPKDGARGGDFGTTLWKSAISWFAIVHENEVAPTYSGSSSDMGRGYSQYKSSETGATAYSGAAINNASLSTANWNNIDAIASVSLCVRIRSKAKMSVYISNRPGQAGFMKNCEYNYVVIYSE